MLISSKSMSEINKLKTLLSREFDMKDLGVAKKIFMIEIRRDRALGRLWLSHNSYVGKVLERFSMENAKPVSTSLVNHLNCLLLSAYRQMMKCKTCDAPIPGGHFCTLFFFFSFF